MRNRHEVFASARIANPYGDVRETWLKEPLGILQHATTTHLSGLFGATLRVPIGPVEVTGDIVVDIVSIEDSRSPTDEPVTKLVIEWGAMSAPALFPKMRATLLISPLTTTDTKLELRGTCEPPLGWVGEVADVIAMHHVAQESARHLVEDVARYLGRDNSHPVVASSS